MKFTEASLEQAVIQLFTEQGYEYCKGDTIHKTMDDVLLEEGNTIYSHVHNNHHFPTIISKKYRNSLKFSKK